MDISKLPIAQKRGKPITMNEMSRKDHLRFEKILLGQIADLKRQNAHLTLIVSRIKGQRDYFKNRCKQ